MLFTGGKTHFCTVTNVNVHGGGGGGGQWTGFSVTGSLGGGINHVSVL